MNQNLPVKRSLPTQRRLLGEARRETAEAAHIAASKRRRRLVAATTEAEGEDELDDDVIPAPVASGALGDDDAAVFADAVYEEDDKEADMIYEQVDLRMQSRRQKQRDQVLQQQLKEYRDANPTVRQQFADLKADLRGVALDEWAAIPDIGDYSVKKQKFQKFTPVPDSLLERARQENAYVATEASNADPTTDLAAIGAGRTSVLEHNLDQLGERTETRPSVDHDGYLSAMTGAAVAANTEIGDIKRARSLLKSVTTANPRHAPGWIASARLEEKVGKLSDARKLILDGCQKCPRDDEVWIEAARLHPTDVARRILAQAVRHTPKSSSIWMCAANLERDADGKRRVLQKALEILPHSEALWEAAIELENPRGARILLSRAVECVPKSRDLWLALAKLEPYDEAKRVLQQARKFIPEDLAIWLAEAQLEEAQHGADSQLIDQVISEAIVALSFNKYNISRSAWLEQAQVIDEAGYIGTVRAIVANAAGIDVADEARKTHWLDDVKHFENKGFMNIARAFLYHLTRTFSKDIDLWISYVQFERRHDEFLRMQDILWDAVRFCPQADIFWLMLAKDKWKRDGVQSARRVLQKAFEALPEAESIWLAAAKVETKSGEFAEARRLLQTARTKAPSAKVYMKSALLERQLGDKNAEKRLLQKGLENFPKGEKLWLMLAQWFERGEQQNGHASNISSTDGSRNPNLEDSKSEIALLWDARGVYVKAVEYCRSCVPLWIGHCRLEERSGNVSKARAILERGREQCEGVADIDLLWRESVYLEVRHSRRMAAQAVLARGMQKCKQSGRLWALSLALEGRKGQKARSVDAIKACPQDATVILEVAKYIWRSGKTEKARTWLNRSLQLNPDLGDGWATLLALEMDVGNEEGTRNAITGAEKAEPKYGDIWTSVSKTPGNETLGCVQILTLAAGKKKDLRKRIRFRLETFGTIFQSLLHLRGVSAGMVCCFSHSVLTKAERDAIARLREQRAQGRAPGATTHRAVVEHLDPVVSFYSSANLASSGGYGRTVGPRRPALPAPQRSTHFSPSALSRHTATKRTHHHPPPLRKHGSPVASDLFASGSSSSSSLPSDLSPAPRKLRADTVLNMSAPRNTHQRKVAARRAPRPVPSPDPAAKASLLSAARDVIAHRWRSDGNEPAPPRADKLRDGATALVGALKALSARNAGRTPDDPASASAAIAALPRQAGDVNPAKGADDEDLSDSADPSQKVAVADRPVGRIAWTSRKKLDHLMSKLGGSSAKGERFVMKARPELSDLTESKNDAYFQELMKGD